VSDPGLRHSTMGVSEGTDEKDAGHINRLRHDKIRITGSKHALLAGLVNPENVGKGVVPSFVRKWWAHQDSNLGPAD